MYARTNFVLNISAFGVVRSVCTGAVDSAQVRNASTVHVLVARSDTLRFLEVATEEEAPFQGDFHRV